MPGRKWFSFSIRSVRVFSPSSNSSPDLHGILINFFEDSCPREAVAAWLSSLRRSRCPVFPFHSASAFMPAASESQVTGKGKAKERADDALGVDALLGCLARYAEQKEGGEEALVVTVVGLTNVGPLVYFFFRRQAG